MPSFDSGGGDVRAFVASEEAAVGPGDASVGSDVYDASAAFGGAMLRVFAVSFRAPGVSTLESRRTDTVVPSSFD